MIWIGFCIAMLAALVPLLWPAVKRSQVAEVNLKHEPICRVLSDDCFGDPLPDCPSRYCLIHHTAICRRSHSEEAPR